MKGLQELIDVFKDDRSHLAIGQILSLHLADDNSFLKVKVSVMPEQREMIATMTWDSVGPESGSFTFPVAGDLVLVAFAEGDDDLAFILKRLTSKEDKIPLNAIDGHSVLKTIAGKKIWQTSDTRINLSKTDEEPTENFILGQVWKSFMLELLQIQIDTLQTLSKETHTGNLGYMTTVPTQASDYTGYKGDVTALKSSPVDDELILSDLTFSEK